MINFAAPSSWWRGPRSAWDLVHVAVSLDVYSQKLRGGDRIRVGTSGSFLDICPSECAGFSASIALPAH
jgi:hypothetical protein